VSRLFVGLDLGTSSVKVGLFNEAGRLLHLARRGYRLYMPHPGWAEQEPVEWWEATRAALWEVLTGVDKSQIAAVGLSGQTPGHVLVSAGGRSLGRAIVWSDRRAIAKAAWLAERITQQQARAWTGYPFISGATQPPARLLWLKTHRPDDWNRCTAIVQPKDFIALQLTGRTVTDLNSGFCLLHPETGRYHADYLALLGVEPEKMPSPLSPTDEVGPVTPGAAAITGLPAGTPVVIGTIDAWCDIVGCGGAQPGCAVDVAGTSEVVALVTDQPVEGDGVFSSPLVEGHHWTGGPMQMGGAALEWLARGFYGGELDLEQVEAEASSVAPGAEGLLFLPYLRGERAPIWDDAARGAFVGLTVRHTRAHCARAVYEGVAFAVWDVLERSLSAAGTLPLALRVSGGGARSTLWNQIKADVTGLLVQQMAVSDAACLGAAILAATGVGAFDGLSDATAAMTHPAATFEPQAAHAAVYRTLFSLWRSLYPALQSTFSHLSQMAELDRSDWESGRDGGMPSRPIRPGDREVSP
jgi:xylulokinase